MTAAQQYALLNKQTAAKRETAGFNLDSLQNASTAALIDGYDQVQIKSGAQQLILQRAVSGNSVTPQADLNANGVLQIVPDVGPARTNLIAAQTAEANAAKPAWEKYAIPVAIGVAAIVAVVVAIRHG